MNVPAQHSLTAPASGLPAGPPLRWEDLPVRREVTQIGPYAIHWLGVGEEAGEPVVLIHGLSGSSRWWARNIRGLATDFRLLIPDLIGFGRSRATDGLPAIGEVADLLCEWAERIGVPCAHLVGHSMGGQISVHLAARYPERVGRLVLADAAGIPRPLTPRALARFAFELAPPRAWGDPRFLPVILRDALTAGPRSILQATAHIIRDDVRPLLPRIQAPSLIVWGERDTLIPLAHAREFRRRIRNSRLVVLRRAAHNPMVDRPAEFNRIVRRFLSGERVGS